MSGVIAIVGRPNVGKSTLFNRLVGGREAIMDDQSGVTRDRHYGLSEWNGRGFSVIDTGGYVVGSDDRFESAIRGQVDQALKEADVILFMVDARVGLTDLDRDFAGVIRRTGRPVVVAANKIDQPKDEAMAAEFYGMGFPDVFPLASASGAGTGDLLDLVVNLLPEEPEAEPLELDEDGEPIEKDTPPPPPRIAVVGRPNVGKSSLINEILGAQRSIVTEEAGTTRDAVDAPFSGFGLDLVLVDTAGIRRKAKVSEDIEFYSVMRAVRAIEYSDVCLMILDATRGYESQDTNIMRMAHRHKKGVVIVVNKWDLIEKDHKTMLEYEKTIREKLGPEGHIPIIFISVKERQRVLKALEEAVSVAKRMRQRISTSKLNEWLRSSVQAYGPPAVRGHTVQMNYATQLPTPTPTIAIFTNKPDDVKESYTRYLENKLRDAFPLNGVPVRIIYRQKS